MPEKITFGIKNVHYASVTTDSDGSPTFGAVKTFKGASEMSLPPVGDAVKVYADDAVYYKGHVNQGYEGDLNVYSVPEDFKTNHLGEYKDTNGVMIEKSNAQPDDFALLGEFQADDSPKRFALYNCTAGRSDFTGKTKENSIEPNSFSIPITVSPIESDEIVKASIKKSDNPTVYNAWFNSVYYNPGHVAVYKATITITDGTDPIAGAVVVAGEKISKTDSNGEAAFLLSDDTYDVLVSASGFTAKTSSITVSGAAATLSVTMAV